MVKPKKKAQIFGMPFTFLFALILIAVFLFTAIWAIRHFLHTTEYTKLMTSINDLRTQVQTLWQQRAGRVTVTLLFPKSFEKICFADPNDKSGWAQESDLRQDYNWVNNVKANLFLLPRKAALDFGLKGYLFIGCGNVDCLDFNNPTCITIKNGKVRLRLTMQDDKVWVEEA